MVAGERVRRIPTGEDGAVLDVRHGALVQVAFASGTVWINCDELEKLPEGPAERNKGRSVRAASASSSDALTLLKRFHERLDVHFRTLHDQRQQLESPGPVFALEH